jgi:hypothetical protein
VGLGKSVAIGFSALSIVGIVACGGGSDAKAKVIGHASSSTSSSTTTTTTLPSNVGKVGDKIRTQLGNVETVYGYEQPSPAPQFMTPDAGKEYAAADIEACVNADLTKDPDTGAAVPPDQQVISVNPYDYQLMMPDNTRLQPTFGAREPALNATDVEHGQCVRGWVSWQVPIGVRPVSIVDTKTGPPAIQWQVA